MLTPVEQRDVLAALADRLAELGDVRAFISSTFQPNEMELLRAMPVTLSLPKDCAAFVLSCCLDSQWTLAPSLLENLLTTLVAAGRAEFVPARTRVSQRIDPNPDPLQTLWLNTGMPFFDRGTLRPLLKDLLGNDTRPILRIIGNEKRCGKSYTRELFEHIRDEARADLRIVSVALPEGTGPSYAVEELAEALVAPTGKDLATRPARANSSYPRTLCRWVLNAAIQAQGKWIFVLDGFNQGDVMEETRALVQSLAVEIAGGEFRKRMRLVLLDYGAALPSVQGAKVMTEEVPPVAALSENELVDCLAAHYADLAKRGIARPPVAPTELQKIAATLLAQTNGTSRLEELNATLSRLRHADLHP